MNTVLRDSLEDFFEAIVSHFGANDHAWLVRHAYDFLTEIRNPDAVPMVCPYDQQQCEFRDAGPASCIHHDQTCAARHHAARPRCLDCGLPYEDFPMDMLLPRSQWLTIHPADGGLLCAQCIVVRAAKITRATAVHAIIEIAP